MNPEVKARWVAALRSGEYQQGRAALRQNDHDGTPIYCCLGVLCELAVEDGVVERGLRGYRVSEHGDGYVNTIPPLSVLNWAGHGVLDAFPCDGWNQSLPGLNDRGTPFTDIADVIEEHL